MTERILQEAGYYMRKAVVRRSSSVAACDDGDEVNKVLPSVTPKSVSGIHEHRRMVVEWEQVEDEWLREHMKMLSTVEEKKTKTARN